MHILTLRPLQFKNMQYTLFDAIVKFNKWPPKIKKLSLELKEAQHYLFTQTFSNFAHTSVVIIL